MILSPEEKIVRVVIPSLWRRRPTTRKADDDDEPRERAIECIDRCDVRDGPLVKARMQQDELGDKHAEQGENQEMMSDGEQRWTLRRHRSSRARMASVTRPKGGRSRLAKFHFACSKTPLAWERALNPSSP